MNEAKWRRLLKIPPGVVRYKYLALPIAEVAERPIADLTIGVFIHAFYEREIERILPFLANIDRPFDLFVSTDAPAKKDHVAAALRPRFGEAPVIRVFENRGRDIAPKFVGFAAAQRRYDLVLHLHAKKSPQNEKLADWLDFILKGLLGSKEITRSIFGLFAAFPQLGVIAPRVHPDRSVVFGVQWGQNYFKTAYLARRMGVRLQRATKIDFPAGSMFWARSAALAPLLDLELPFSSFEPEHGQIDGTTAHAVERLIFYSAERAGYKSLHVGASQDAEIFETLIGPNEIEQGWVKTR